MPDIKEIIFGFITFIIGFYIISEITKSLNIQFGSLFVGLFVVIAIAWFIKEVFGRWI